MRVFVAFVLVALISGPAMANPAVPSATAQKPATVSTSVDRKILADGDMRETKKGPPQFAVETFPSQLFWLVVSFSSLYLLLSGAVLPRIGQGMEARDAHIKGLLADALRIRDEAEANKTEISSAVDAAYHHASDLLNKAAMEAQEVANRRNHELEAVLAAKQKASLERIAAARSSAVQAIHDASQFLVPAIMEKLARLTVSEDQVTSAVNAASSRVSLRGVA